MSDREPVVLEVTRLEAAHLTGLVSQFIDLLEASTVRPGGAPADPAVARLVPDAYADDEDAAREFRAVTERDLIDRRTSDARTVLDTLDADGPQRDAGERADDVMTVVRVALDDQSMRAWLRTLTALRLVLASRLGISTEDDHDEEDPRFGVYDWLGFRLDGLVRAVEAS